MGNRDIGKCLPDNRDAIVAHFVDDVRLENPSGCRIKCLGIVEGSLLGQEDILGQKFAFEVTKVFSKDVFTVSELEMPGHRRDAEQIRGFDHISALREIGQTAALPQVAAIDQQRTSGGRRGAQHIDQSLEMSEAAQSAVPTSLLLEVEKGEGVSLGAACRNAELF